MKATLEYDLIKPSILINGEHTGRKNSTCW